MMKDEIDVSVLGPRNGSKSGDESRPLQDVRELISGMPGPDSAAGAAAAEALVAQYHRAEEFGRLSSLGRWLASWQRRNPPRIEKPVTAVFVSGHGLADAGVSVSSSVGVLKHLEALRQGRTALNAIAAHEDVTIRAFELAVENPTPNIAEAPAMTPKACASTIAYGFEALAEDPDTLAVGVMGAGVGTAAAAIACALYGGDPRYWVRPGPGTDPEIARKRAELVSEALKRHRGVGEDPLLALATLGGRELAACVGAIIAARHQGVPVILDGFATAVAAAVIKAVRPDGIDHCVVANKTLRPAHEALLERIGLNPLMDLGLMWGGGLGSTLAFGLLRNAAALHVARPDDASS